MDEYGPGRRQAARLAERLVRKEDPLLLADREGAQARAARAGAARELAVRGMAVLRGAQRAPYFSGDGVGDAVAAKSDHEHERTRRAPDVPSASCRHSISRKACAFADGRHKLCAG